MTIGTTAVNLDDIKESPDFLDSWSRLAMNSAPRRSKNTIMNDFEEIGAWLGRSASVITFSATSIRDNCISHGLHMVSKEKALDFQGHSGEV
jgi:hypothetical protein